MAGVARRPPGAERRIPLVELAVVAQRHGADARDRDDPAAHVAKLPAGSLVELKGRLRCASPVIGELSNAACAHFVSTVECDYEFFEYDSHRKTSCCKRKTEIVKTTTQFAPFEIELIDELAGRLGAALNLSLIHI